MSFKNPLPVQQFTEDVVLDDPQAAAVFQNRLGTPVARDLTNAADLVELVRRRYWYFIRTGRDNSRCPAHQRVVTKMYFDIVNDPKLNARATTWRDYNIIGTYRGAIVNTFSFFHFLLAHPTVLVDFGFPSQEDPWLVSLAGCDWSGPLGDILRKMRTDPAYADAPSPPKDWFRQSIADTLATMALDFVFFHEVAHLRRGHLKFLGEGTGTEKIDEMKSNEPSNLKRSRQALELDADGGAMEVLLTPWFKGKHVKGFQTDQAGPAEAIELWTFAIAVLLFLFDPFPRGITSYQNAEHSHTAVRLLHIYVQASHVAQTISPEAVKLFQDNWWRALEQVGVAFLQFDLPSAIIHSLNNEAFKDVIGEQQRLVAHLANLVNEHESLKM